MVRMPTRTLRLRRRSDGYYATSWVDDQHTVHQKTFGRLRPRAETLFSRFHVEWKVNDTIRNPHGETAFTIEAAWERFRVHAQAYYRRENGEPTGEAANLADAMRPVLELCAMLPCAQFGPRVLKQVRDRMIADELCISTINARVNRIRRVFQWLASEELIGAEIWHGLKAVAPLRPGRTAARMSEPVQPVTEEYVEAVARAAPETIAAMIRLQMLTGMRPGELCAMRPMDIEMGVGAVWIYRPAQHKTRHRQRGRVVVLGPQAKEIVRRFLDRDTAAPLFRPLEAMNQRWGRRRTHRPESYARKIGEATYAAAYVPKTYARCIGRLCDLLGMPPWSPNQLRHNFATRMRREFDLEVASIALGHSKMDVTQIYAARDMARLIRAMEMVG